VAQKEETVVDCLWTKEMQLGVVVRQQQVDGNYLI
jgi:hypothetical protein